LCRIEPIFGILRLIGYQIVVAIPIARGQIAIAQFHFPTATI